MESLGEKISVVLEDLENLILEHDSREIVIPYNFTNEGFGAAIHIFVAVLMDKMWNLQEEEGIAIEDRQKMAEQAGSEIRRIVKTYTGIDTFDRFK